MKIKLKNAHYPSCARRNVHIQEYDMVISVYAEDLQATRLDTVSDTLL